MRKVRANRRVYVFAAAAVVFVLAVVFALSPTASGFLRQVVLQGRGDLSSSQGAGMNAASKALLSEVAKLATTTTVSDLSADVRAKAEKLFTSQHDDWLGIRSFRANYSWTMRWMEHGGWSTYGRQVPRTGTLTYQVLPCDPAKLGRSGQYVQIRLHVYDNETKWHGVTNDTISEFDKTIYWQEGHSEEKSMTRPQPPLLQMLLTDIYALLGSSFKSASWDSADRTPERFFSDFLPVSRMSTKDETEKNLGGEQCYLFSRNVAEQPRIWISATSGNIHQYEMTTHGRTQTLCLTDYVEDRASKLKFPSRIVDTMLEGEGSKCVGSESTVVLTDISINPDLPPDTFY